MSYAREKELREQRHALVLGSRRILDEAGGELSAEQDAQVRQAHKDADELTKKIEAIAETRKAQDDLEARIAKAQEGTRSGPRTRLEAEDQVQGEARDHEEEAQKRERLFRQWVADGDQDMDREERAMLGTRRKGRGSEVEIRKLTREERGEIEQRAQSAILGSTGGYTVGGDLDGRIEIAMKAFGGVRRVADVITTASGVDLPLPTMDDTSNTGRLIGENTSVTTTNLTFGQIVLSAYKYSSDIVLVPFELLQDTAVDIVAIIGDALGERIGRIANTHATTGDGASKPEGIVNGSSLGTTATGTTSITADELIDLEGSVDPAYVEMGASWMFNNSTFYAVQKLKDGSGDYLWQPGLEVGAPPRLRNHPYVINQDMASIASAAKPILFGNMKKYRIRDVAGLRLLRLDERYADADQVAFVAFKRMDGKLFDAGQAPVKHLLMA